MKKLLNTLYVTQPDVYMAIQGENIVLKKENENIAKLPLHNLESIVSFGYTGASPGLMGYCAKNNISIIFMTMNGRYLARVIGETRGNVTLRKEQYRISDDLKRSGDISKNFLIGKIFNNKWVVERTIRDHELRVNKDQLKQVSGQLSSYIERIKQSNDIEELRGWEGQAANTYNKVFNQLILNQKEHFYLHSRNRRPPLDNVNAILSFVYTLLANDVASSLEGVGLDSYVGFLHRDRPGRISLALDVMEELRGCYADRFVLSLINRNIVTDEDFSTKENGAVLMSEESRKRILKMWQNKKQETMTHPFLAEKISWGLLPHVQSLLLARYIRGDLDEYPPFLWK